MFRLLNLRFLLLVVGLTVVSCRSGYGEGEQDWGHVEVRKDAYMFYWLHYTTAAVHRYTERPLVIWLQGGPGSSSTGHGNFDLLGPFYPDGKRRNHTWVKDMNVLFIDSPVGTGFSYVDRLDLLASNDETIVQDLLTFIKVFFNLHPEFQRVPLHIFGQSYGGKIAPQFALSLYRAIERNEISCSLVSVACGNPWLSPVDSQLSWAPFLLQAGVIDEPGYEIIMDHARLSEQRIRAGDFVEARRQSQIYSLIKQLTFGVNFYNIETPMATEPKQLIHLMNTDVARALNIRGLHWIDLNNTVFAAVGGEFMKSGVHSVQELLNSTPIKVSIYSGNWDLICATPGTVKWIDNMQWLHKQDYQQAPRQPIYVNNALEGYKKVTRNFNMYWVKRAGHNVPADNPAAMSAILKELVGYA